MDVGCSHEGSGQATWPLGHPAVSSAPIWGWWPPLPCTVTKLPLGNSATSDHPWNWAGATAGCPTETAQMPAGRSSSTPMLEAWGGQPSQVPEGSRTVSDFDDESRTCGHGSQEDGGTPRGLWAGTLGLQCTWSCLKRLVVLRGGAQTSLTMPTEGGQGQLPGGGLTRGTQGPK